MLRRMLQIRNLMLALAVVSLCLSFSPGWAAPDNSPIQIGVISAFTGSQAAFGQAHKNGYEIALKEINDKGGINGHPVALVYYDDQSKPDQAVQGVSKLVDQDHVNIILGSYSSESSRAIVPMVTQKQVPLIMPTATADNVMETGSQWVFRVCAGSGAYAAATIDFLKNNGNPKTIAIIYENTNFGQSNFKSMTDAATAAGMQIVDTEAYQASSPDYKSLLQRVKSKNPDVIYFASYLLDATTLMRQAEQVNLNPKYYTSAGTGFAAAEFPSQDKGAGRNAEFTFSTSQWLPSAKWKGSAEFDQKFFQRTGAHPAYHAMEAYAALLVAAKAIGQAKNKTAEGYRDALRAINLTDTPFGPVKFDAKGQNPHPILITQIQKGDYKVVWPKNAAQAQPVIPTPPWSSRK